MKNTFIALLLCCVGLFSCLKVDETDAKKRAEELLNLIKTHQYEPMADFYTPELNLNEPAEVRQQKFGQIEAASGAIKSFELKSTENKTIDERNVLTLTYLVHCEQMDLTHILTLANEEGKSVVINHQITNQ